MKNLVLIRTKIFNSNFFSKIKSHFFTFLRVKKKIKIKKYIGTVKTQKPKKYIVVIEKVNEKMENKYAFFNLKSLKII